MFNTNWSLNPSQSTSNVDWSALADTWMQQREQQAQWQHAPPPPPPPPPPLPPPPPPPPQFLLTGPPIPPPGPMPIGMTFPPLSTVQLHMGPHHHQLQVGSNTTQESLTMTNRENPPWRPPLPPPPMMPSGPQWRPTMNNNQPLFPIPTEMPPSFGGRNFWPPGNTGPSTIPPPVPPPVPPPLPSLPPQPPQFPSAAYQHSPVDKRIMNTSFNTSIPSLMDLPSYKQKPLPPSLPTPPAPILPVDSTISNNTPNVTGGNANAKRRKIPAWLREELGRIEKEKEKKLHNTSTNNHSTNESSSKFDNDDEDEDDDDDDNNNNRTLNRSTAGDDDEDENEDEDETSSNLVSSTPIATRRSRFDDDKPTDSSFNISTISKQVHASSRSPSPPSTTTTTTNNLIEDDDIDKEEQLMIKLRRTLTELLLEVTNEELAAIGKEVYLNCKAESSTPVIRKASGLSSLIQSFSGSDSEDEEEKNIQTIVKTTVITKSPIQPPSIKSENNKSISKSSDEYSKSTKTKKKKSTRDRSPTKKHHQKKHRHHSSSSPSSSDSSPSHAAKKKKPSSSDSKKYDDRGRKH